MSVIHEKLLEIQNELKAPKGQYNDFGKYKYRSCEDILEAVKPILKKHGCVLTITDEIMHVGERYYIKATAKIVAAGGDSGDEIAACTGYAREEETKKGMDGSQITGASSSYARKYALNGLFLIDDSKDSDHTNDGAPAPEKKAQAEKPQGDDPLTASIKSAKDVQTLTSIWDNNPDMHNNQEFIKILSQRKKQLLTK